MTLRHWILAGVITLLTASFTTAFAQGIWAPVVVDPDSSALESYSSLALDAAGDPHISYSGTTGLRHAFRTAGTWTSENVDGLGGPYNDIAVDPQGDIHASYRLAGPGGGSIRYAVRSGGAWTYELVGDPGTVAHATPIALDSQDLPHVAFRQVGPSRLWYAMRAVGSWTTEAVDTAGAVYSSLALDATDAPRIAYHHTDGTLLQLRYAYKSGGVWTREVVDVGGQWCSLALDAQGNPHVSYIGQSLRMRYARKSAGVWSIEVVDSQVANHATSIALDPLGNPAVSYWVAGRLQYARKSGGVWVREIASDAAGNDGIFSSLAFDPLGRASISFENETTSDLLFVVRLADSSAIGVELPAAPLDGTLLVAPNPAPGGDAELFLELADLARLGPVEIAIYDATGRRVRTLAHGALGASPLRLRWDGRDNSGRSAAPGKYLIRADAGGRVRSASVVVVR